MTAGWLRIFSFLLMVYVVNSDSGTTFSKRSDQEEALSDYAMSVRIAVCNSKQWTDATTASFRHLLAALANEYCANLTLCQLVTLNGSSFTPNSVAFLDGYPSWDFNAIHARFVIVYPNSVVLLKKQKRPLLPKAVISDIIRVNFVHLVKNLGWDILSYDRFPKFDKVTEFMNVALLPLGILIGIIMYGIAYCATSFSWTPDVMVAGTGGGKNTAAQRIKDIIEADKQQAAALAGGRYGGSRANSEPILLSIEQLKEHRQSRPKVTLRGDSDSDTATIISGDEPSLRLPGVPMRPGYSRGFSMGGLSASSKVDIRRPSMAEIQKAKMKDRRSFFGSMFNSSVESMPAQRKQTTAGVNLFMRAMTKK